jgi:hypothetical protein
MGLKLTSESIEFSDSSVQTSFDLIEGFESHIFIMLKQGLVFVKVTLNSTYHVMSFVKTRLIKPILLRSSHLGKK